MAQQNSHIVPLCSQCIRHEITSWLNEKSNQLKPKITHEIVSELKSIKINKGSCIVCNHNSIIGDSTHNILKILEHHNTPKEILQEFRRFFCFETGAI